MKTLGLLLFVVAMFVLVFALVGRDLLQFHRERRDARTNARNSGRVRVVYGTRTPDDPRWGDAHAGRLRAFPDWPDKDPNARCPSCRGVGWAVIRSSRGEWMASGDCACRGGVIWNVPGPPEPPRPPLYRPVD